MTPRPIRGDALWLVESVRYVRGRPERVTRLFRQSASARRFADRQVDVGRGPVRLWRAPAPTWTEVRS